MFTFLSNYFEFKQLQTNYRQEIIAGTTTFLTMVYIVMVNPAILSQSGLDANTAFVATCLVATLGSFLCGFFSNYPIALAPSMCLNAYFTFSVVNSGQLTLGQALAAVVIAGIVFFLLTLFRIRDWLLQAIPPALSHAIGAGIGLFIGFIGLKQLGIIVSHPSTLVTLGAVTTWPVILGLVGFCLIIILDIYRVPGAILISILAMTLLGTALHVTHLPTTLIQLPHFSTAQHLVDMSGLMTSHGMMIIFTFLLVALFDSTGTLVSLLYQAGFSHQPHVLRRINRAFYAESLVTIAGGFLGTSTTGPYVENASGIAAGGRSGLTAITVGFLFFCMLLLAPFATAIPVFAYAPALLFVAYKMCLHLERIQWANPCEGVPAVIILLLIPLTFSIANGIAIGFIVYTIINVASGKLKELHYSTWILLAVFILYLGLVNH